MNILKIFLILLLLFQSFLYSNEDIDDLETQDCIFCFPYRLQNMLNAFGSEYGYNFIPTNNQFSASPIIFPTHHFAFDAGFPGFSRSHLAFGAKMRYEYEFGNNRDGVHRLGVEFYYHPHFLRYYTTQILSPYVGIGGRLANAQIPSGVYMDTGVLILPSYIAYASINYRADFIPNIPTQHSFRLSLHFPLGLWLAPFAFPLAGITATTCATLHNSCH